MYFFARPRVDVGDEPHSVGDVQRSFLVLRPLVGAETTPAKDSANCRLLILPKKKLPGASKHERFLFAAASTASDYGCILINP